MDVHAHRCSRCVPVGVGDRLLHDPVCRQPDRCGHLPHLLVHPQLDLLVDPGGPGHELGQVRQGRCRGGVGVVFLLAQEAHDLLQTLGGPGRLCGDLVQEGEDLGLGSRRALACCLGVDHHGGHVVGRHVVKLPGHPGPLRLQGAGGGGPGPFSLRLGQPQDDAQAFFLPAHPLTDQRRQRDEQHTCPHGGQRSPEHVALQARRVRQGQVEHGAARDDDEDGAPGRAGSAPVAQVVGQREVGQHLPDEGVLQRQGHHDHQGVRGQDGDQGAVHEHYPQHHLTHDRQGHHTDSGQADGAGLAGGHEHADQAAEDQGEHQQPVPRARCLVEQGWHGHTSIMSWSSARGADEESR